jgi:hypothetical protein
MANICIKNTFFKNTGKAKGKVILRTYHEDTEGGAEV